MPRVKKVCNEKMQQFLFYGSNYSNHELICVCVRGQNFGPHTNIQIKNC